jgi:hypothetical protein
VAEWCEKEHRLPVVERRSLVSRISKLVRERKRRREAMEAIYRSLPPSLLGSGEDL